MDVQVADIKLDKLSGVSSKSALGGRDIIRKPYVCVRIQHAEIFEREETRGRDCTRRCRDEREPMWKDEFSRVHNAQLEKRSCASGISY